MILISGIDADYLFKEISENQFNQCHQRAIKLAIGEMVKWDISRKFFRILLSNGCLHLRCIFDSHIFIVSLPNLPFDESIRFLFILLLPVFLSDDLFCSHFPCPGAQRF